MLTNYRLFIFIVFLRTSWCCQPKSNIVFLKTHKTAGSSIQNIFLRYAYSHQLLVVLPFRSNYFGHPSPFRLHMAPPLKASRHYNILTHHARFNSKAMRQLMPPDTLFITILRNPIALFESMYEYYRLKSNCSSNDTTTFAEYITHNNTTSASHDCIWNRKGRRFGRNQMLFDLGVSPDIFDNDLAVSTAIQRLDRQFHLVLISEFMDQSLVLLKHLLCWSDYDDVVTLRHNARVSKYKNNLNSYTIKKLSEINRADYLLYTYFYHKFLDRVKEFGEERMRDEVGKLRDATERMYRRCIAANDVPKFELELMFQVYSNQVNGYMLKDEAFEDQTCVGLITPELPFTYKLRKRQKSFYSNYSTWSLPTRSSSTN